MIAKSRRVLKSACKGAVDARHSLQIRNPMRCPSLNIGLLLGGSTSLPLLIANDTVFFARTGAEGADAESAAGAEAGAEAGAGASIGCDIADCVEGMSERAG